jgi:endoglucanase
MLQLPRRVLLSCLGCAALTIASCGGDSNTAPSKSSSSSSVVSSSTNTPTSTASGNSGGSGASLAVKVSGSHLVDASGTTLQLRGMNVSGLESVAIQGWDPTNPWGSQTGDASPNWSLIRSWGANAVRLPLNEASWLGLSCSDLGGGSVTVTSTGTQVQDAPGQIIEADPGHNYQATVIQSVSDANAAGLYVILDLHWAAPNNNGTPTCPTTQNAMADADHSSDFWTSLANTFKGNPAVLFELFNEPFVGESSQSSSDTQSAWYYILNGGATEAALLAAGNPGTISFNWVTTGYQQLLDAIRATGATNVILAGTDSWTQTMTAWLQYAPKDPLGQLAASWHPYPAAPYGPANQVICPGLTQCSAQEMTAVQAILAAGYPVVATEFGDAVTSSPGNTAPWASVLLPFADQNGISYLGWTWDVWSGATADVLITDEAGDPTNGYGTYVQQHYLCVAAGTETCP